MTMNFKKNLYIQNVERIPECVVTFNGDEENVTMIRKADTIVSEIMFILDSKFNRNIEKFKDKLQSHKVWDKVCEDDHKILYTGDFDTIGLFGCCSEPLYTFKELIDNELPVMVIDIDTSSKNMKLSFCGRVIGVIGNVCNCSVRNEYRSYIIQDIGNTVYNSTINYHNLWLDSEYLPDLRDVLVTDMEDSLVPGDMYWDSDCKENRSLYAAVAVPSDVRPSDTCRVYVVNTDGHSYMKEFFPFEHAKVLDANGVEIKEWDTVITDVNEKGDGSYWAVMSVSPNKRYPVHVKKLGKFGVPEDCERDLKPEWCHIKHRDTITYDITDSCSETLTVDENDNVNHPSHYETSGVECIDAMIASQGKEAVKQFCLCNAFKYIWRNKNKGKSLEDIKKAQWYINKYLELEG